jgi:putative selenate reductase
MNDDLHPLSFPRLIDWIGRERDAQGTLFGIHRDLCHWSLAGKPYAMQRHGRHLEAPVGVAAGPHTQLSQNIVAAWACGARVFELKTVQDRDDLVVPRPCIDMTDEGYNCEWSQELPIDVSFAQYADAWTAIRLLQREMGAYDEAEPGFLFDASIGYDLAGIRGAKVQRYLDRLAHPGAEIAARLAAIGRGDDIALPDHLAPSVTLSTMHGCPPDEIERIGRHLIGERGLPTAIKLNPTLLGAHEVRDLIGEALGYDVEIPDDVFAHDLAFADAVDILRSLQEEADRVGVGFGVKLTNTLACRNRRGVLPASEPMVYLSGRALHPLAVRTALKLQEAFGGSLDVSFAGGVDATNVGRVVSCGLAPATACSDLLRPGGYLRLRQYLEVVEAAGPPPGRALALGNLRTYGQEVVVDPAYQRATYADRSIRTSRVLGGFDCIGAPCVWSCPTDQDVPEYLHHAARGDDRAALAVILRDNPLPTVSGMVCDHPCEQKCTRVNLDAAVGIRDVKRYLAHATAEPPLPELAPATGRRVAVIGGGPAGLACAYTLALAGVAATVYEARDHVGGMVTDAIPGFRLRAEDFASDVWRLGAVGVEARCGEDVDAARFAALRREHDAVFVAVGEQCDRPLGILGEDRPEVVPALRFLAAVRRNQDAPVRGEVAVIGGGNTAMDAARTAARLPGVTRVHLVYRRTLAEMPAAREELHAVVAEGVEIHELLAPAAITQHGGRLALQCRPMRLGRPDASGRRRPEPLGGATVTLLCDAVVPAIGQQLACSFCGPDELRAAGPDGATALPGVYVGGDARRGAATLVDAIADGRRAAAAILAHFGLPLAPEVARATRELDLAAWQDRAARRVAPHRPRVRADARAGDFSLVVGELTAAEARAEAARCLDCDDRCDVCVAVCPNRANIAYDAAPGRWDLTRVVRDGDGFTLAPDGAFALAQGPQTCHVADFCNDCGNCETFCPTSGAPFRDKPRFAVHAATYAQDDDIHLLTRGVAGSTIRHRRASREVSLTVRGETAIYTTPEARLELDPRTLAVRAVTWLAATAVEVRLQPAAALAVLLTHLADTPLAIDEES